MYSEANKIDTGSVVGRYDGAEGEELAVAIRMPRTTWARVTDSYLRGHDNSTYPDDEHRLSAQLRLFLSIQAVEWDFQSKPFSSDDGDWDRPNDDEEIESLGGAP